MLKDALITSPILKYPDPNKPYTLFTDASKYAWACVLTQEYEHEKDGKVFKINHPITFASGLFKGSQLNWAALTKEAFTIYSSIKKLSYYLEDAEIILWSDHLPLKKFLQKNTLNTKVNNWVVEISPNKIQFEYSLASARPPAFPSTMPHIPSSLDGTRNRKALNRSCSLECGNRTPPSKSNTALLSHGKASANQRLSHH